MPVPAHAARVWRLGVCARSSARAGVGAHARMCAAMPPRSARAFASDAGDGERAGAAPSQSLFEDLAPAYTQHQSRVARGAPPIDSPASALVAILGSPQSDDQKFQQANTMLAELSATGAQVELRPEFITLARQAARQAVSLFLEDPQARTNGTHLRKLQQALAWVVLTAPRAGPRLIESRGTAAEPDMLEETVLLMLQATESPKPDERVLLYQLALVLMHKNNVQFALLERVVEQIALLPPIVSVNYAPKLILDDWRSWCTELVEKLADQVPEGPDQNLILTLHETLDRHLFPSYHEVNAVSPFMGDHMVLNTQLESLLQNIYLGGASLITPQLVAACLPDMDVSEIFAASARSVDRPKRYPTEIEAWLFLKALLISLQTPDVARIDAVYEVWINNLRSVFNSGNRDLAMMIKAHPEVELPQVIADLMPTPQQKATSTAADTLPKDQPQGEEGEPVLGQTLASMSKMLDASQWQGFGDLVIEPPPRVPVKPVPMQLLMGLGFDSFLTLWSVVHRTIMVPSINSSQPSPSWELTKYDASPSTTLFHSRVRQILADMTELEVRPMEKEWAIILEGYISAGREFKAHSRQLASALSAIHSEAIANWEWKLSLMKSDDPFGTTEELEEAAARTPSRLPPHLAPPATTSPELLEAHKRTPITAPDRVLDEALAKFKPSFKGSLAVRVAALMQALHVPKSQGGRAMLEAHALFDEMWDHACENERIGLPDEVVAEKQEATDATLATPGPKQVDETPAPSEPKQETEAGATDGFSVDTARIEALYNFVLETLQLPVNTRVQLPREPYSDGIPPSKFTRQQFLSRPAGHVMRSFFENALWLALRSAEPPILIRMDQRGVTWFTKVLMWAQSTGRLDDLIEAVENSNNATVRRIFTRDRQVREQATAARQEDEQLLVSNKERLLQRRLFEQHLLERTQTLRERSGDSVVPDASLTQLKKDNEQRLAVIQLERIEAGLPLFDPYDWESTAPEPPKPVDWARPHEGQYVN